MPVYRRLAASCRPPHGSPHRYSENDEVTLPNSRMEISYSTRYYRFLPEDGLVTPHKEITPAWADWVAGRDPTLEWILQQ